MVFTVTITNISLDVNILLCGSILFHCCQKLLTSSQLFLLMIEKYHETCWLMRCIFLTQIRLSVNIRKRVLMSWMKYLSNMGILLWDVLEHWKCNIVIGSIVIDDDSVMEAWQLFFVTLNVNFLNKECILCSDCKKMMIWIMQCQC